MEMMFRNNKRWLYLKELCPFIYKNKKNAILIVTFKLGITLIVIGSPLIYRYFINDIIIDGNLNNLFWIVNGYLILYFFQSLFLIQFTIFDNRFKNLLHVDLRKKLLYSYSTISMEKYNKMSKGDIRNVIEEDTQKLQELYSESVNVIFGIITVIVLQIIMVIMDWRLTLFGLLMILCSFILTRFVGDKVKTVSEQYRKGVGELDSVVHHLLQNWKEIKANNLEEQAENEISLKWQEISSFTIKRTFYEYLAGALAVLNLLVITRTSLYFFGGLLIFNGMTTVATMLVFMNYYQQLNQQMTNLTGLMVKFKSDESQIVRVIDTLKMKAEKTTAVLANGDIVLKNVSFCHQGFSEMTLDHINMIIPQKSRIAIVGKSGSGKSTLAKLLLGIVQPTEGNIYIGQTEIRDISEQEVNKKISAVMQEPQFFNISIAENLRLAKKDATMAELDNACSQANIYDFIQSLPDRYDTIIGERGVKLSGGQRQRLAIARILLANPEVIIFDEATSSLDSENEKEIMQAIRTISQEKTIITIAHRFATIADSDYIFLLKEGRLAAQGTTKEMFSDNIEMKQLFQMKLG